MPLKLAIPKRLLLLSVIYCALALLGFMSGAAVIPALLLLMLALSIYAKQQATMWILRGLAVFLLLSVSMMPYLLEQNPQLAELWQSWLTSSVLAQWPSWSVFAIALIGSMLHLWLLFTAKVSRWFARKNNFNIMN